MIDVILAVILGVFLFALAHEALRALLMGYPVYSARADANQQYEMLIEWEHNSRHGSTRKPYPPIDVLRRLRKRRNKPDGVPRFPYDLKIVWKFWCLAFGVLVGVSSFLGTLNLLRSSAPSMFSYGIVSLLVLGVAVRVIRASSVEVEYDG